MTEVADSKKNEADGPYSDHTPAMRQYLMLRDEHPGVMLLYRIGDFYETFFDDAVRINKLIGLTLTKRGTYKGDPRASRETRRLGGDLRSDRRPR